MKCVNVWISNHINILNNKQVMQKNSDWKQINKLNMNGLVDWSYIL